jgi:lipopolysaccharide export system protein LptA
MFMARTSAEHGYRAAGAGVLAGAALLVCTFIATAAPTTGSRAAGAKAADGQISYDALKITASTKNNSVDFEDIVVTWRDIKVKADQCHTTGLDTENNEWTFAGNVRIHSDRGDLHSDKAAVEYKHGEIAKATVTGSPAEFEQATDNAERQVRAHAGEIVYNVADQVLILSGDAVLTIGQAKVEAPQIKYDIRAQTYEAAKQPGTDGRVHGTIPPRQKDPPKDNDNKP